VKVGKVGKGGREDEDEVDDDEDDDGQVEGITHTVACTGEGGGRLTAERSTSREDEDG
jgi:hypothetical protein